MIILLYVMDSLRADFLSCYGYAKDTSPNIDKLAADGVLFTSAFSQSTWTRPSGASLLTAAYPSTHGVMTLEDFLHPSVPTLQERLKGCGFITMAITAMGNIAPCFGFGKGYDVFVELYKEQSVIQKRPKVKKTTVGWEKHFKVEMEEVPIPTSEDINQFLFPFLKQHREEDLFLLIWSIDTHDPFFHRDPRVTRFVSPSNQISWSKDVELTDLQGFQRLKAFYEDMIYYNDYQIGHLVEMLKELKLYDGTFMIVTGDHGESFGEHGTKSHANLPFDEQIKVPLIMKFPYSHYRGRIGGLVQHIDAAPTLLQYLGVSGPSWMQGKSLLPLLQGDGNGDDFIFVETQLSSTLPKFTALRTEGYKYIETIPGRWTFQRSLGGTLPYLKRWVTRGDLLYSLEDDPCETKNIIKQQKGIGKRLRHQTKIIVAENKRVAPELIRKGKLGEDEQVASQLKALGYLE